MREILGKAKTVRELLKGVKYSIDYYQREYKWGEKQAAELVNDLVAKFLEEFDEGHERKKVADYPHYFLGSIIISKKDSASFIVDGQQRLTSLSLFVILLHNLQRERSDMVQIEELIFSEQYGEKSFNIEVDERMACMEALFEGRNFDVSDAPESVNNLYNRYQDIDTAFPEELRGRALPYFVDWLLSNVHLVEITAYSDDDAYTIFETMNDRGLSLNPTDMLKGYLLANIDEDYRVEANNRWKLRIGKLTDWGKEVEADFFKAWLRSQYATKIRERKKGAKQEDFDRIGTEYHRWLRDARAQVGLDKPSDYLRFLSTDFEFYSKQYLHLLDASEQITTGLEHVCYNAWNGFTLQHMLLLAPLKPSDAQNEITQKTRITAKFIDILLTWRLWNFRSIAYSTMQYAMFLVMRDIRGLDAHDLAQVLFDKLQAEEENFDNNSDYHRQGVGLYLHQQNRKVLHRMLARITDYVAVSSGMAPCFEELVGGGSVKYEIEHIWADQFDRHTDEFEHPADFAEQRNRIGGLLLLPKSFNASYNDKPYIDKLEQYFSQNILAKSLHPKCYEHNPGFIRFMKEEGLPFSAITSFKKNNIEERGELYRQIAKKSLEPE
ncbi:GmrSD restriction endonuclease domain-containing protein [Microbulbifer litoralis]|uniref:GmrSD restriction endonuclease domain-containing protein n=1 Tax=Microbulbifer litoralis TaxID=2933965 RepID=UPI0020288E73|nr:DUF262 domain-containing protein [Microbulbifer sp. GX H0434]